MRDQLSSVVARHTGLQKLSTTPIRLEPSPAVAWPITLPTNNTIALLGARWKVIEAVTLSTVPDFPTIGIGWESQFGDNSDNTVWQERSELSAGHMEHHILGGVGQRRPYLITSPPQELDRLILIIGDVLDQNLIDPYSISAGTIRAEISYTTLDEWEDLPNAP